MGTVTTTFFPRGGYRLALFNAYAKYTSAATPADTPAEIGIKFDIIQNAYYKHTDYIVNKIKHLTAHFNVGRIRSSEIASEPIRCVQGSCGRLYAILSCN